MDEKNISIEDKKNFIFTKIEDITDTRSIVEFVVKNDINYSKNKNGMHINISILDHSIIEKLYDIIFYIINDKNNEDIFINKYNEALNELNSFSKKDIVKEKQVYDKIKLDSLQIEMLNCIK